MERGASKSLNYISKKREAERIDRENKKIMHRIINVKPQMPRTSQLKSEFQRKHMHHRKLLMDKNQGVFVEDMIDVKMRFRDETATNIFPKIGPETSKSVYGNRRQTSHSPEMNNSADFQRGGLEYKH